MSHANPTDCTVCCYDRQGHSEFAPIEEFVRLLEPLHFVMAVLANRSRGGFDVVLVTDQANESDRAQIYNHEWEIMRKFSHIGLDVHLIEQNGRRVEEMLQRPLRLRGEMLAFCARI